MALIACKQCAHQVSTDAKSCPSCGGKMPTGTSLGAILGLIVLTLMLYQCAKIILKDSPDQPKKPVNVKEEAEFQATLLLANSLKQNTKNPAKFELVRAILMDDKTVCFEYRGTNSFNAVVYEQKAFGLDHKERPWNSRCANKVGRDMTFVRAALN